MTDIFAEVEEDLRRERAKQLWDRYGWIATLALVLIVGATAAYQGWHWYSAREAASASDRYAAAVRAIGAGQGAASAQEFEKLQDAPSGYQLLSRFHQAALLAQGGDLASALVIWNRIAADTTTPERYRDLAALMAALHELDEGDPASLSTRLATLGRPDGAFRFSARELQAALAERQGQRDHAASILRELTNAEDAPTALRNRASEALGALMAATPAGS